MLAEKAELLLGAIRLPDSAFRENARTEGGDGHPVLEEARGSAWGRQ